MAKRTKTDRILGSLKARPQIKAPIASDMFLPNNSGDHQKSIKRNAPAGEKDLVNKEYVDTLTTNHPHQDVTTTAGPSFAATTTIMGVPYASDDTSNLFIGLTAGEDNTPSGITEGQNNTFIGNEAGKENTTGYRNFALGSQALFINTIGRDNTAMGVGTLKANISGNNNIALGYSVLLNSTSSNNVGIGSSALTENTSGASNVGVGAFTLLNNSTGAGNVAIGHNAGRGTAGNRTFNTFIGYKSAYAITSGDNNICIGYQSGDNLTTGSDNIIIGHDINASAVGVSNELNIGNAIKGQLDTGDIQITGGLTSGTGILESSSDNLDVSGMNTLLVDTTNPIVLGGFSGGINGQQIYIAKQETDNILIIEHLEGAGTQKFVCPGEKDLVISSKFGGAIAFFHSNVWWIISHTSVSGATATITASSDTTDVSGINTLFINITGDIVLGGLVGGVDGQVLNIIMIGNFVNHLTLEHAEGIGGDTQDFINHLAADEQMSHGGNVYVCNGTNWYDASHARHV